ncbi:hypothetical protein LEP1GSC073_2024 [Leptospira noguchii str. Cascata]|nr:hypothetical protein LEP1GSC073_2024 [Leptospira noguchii str. Cascata]
MLGNVQKYKIPIRYREYIQEIRTSNRMTKERIKSGALNFVKTVLIIKTNLS